MSDRLCCWVSIIIGSVIAYFSGAISMDTMAASIYFSGLTLLTYKLVWGK